jgi:hypothetical protein
LTELEAVNVVHSGGTIRLGEIKCGAYETMRNALLVYSSQMNTRQRTKQSQHALAEVRRLDKALNYDPHWKTTPHTGDVGSKK